MRAAGAIFFNLQARIRGGFYVFGNSNWIGVRLASLSVGFWYPLQQNTLNLPSFPYNLKKSWFFAYIPNIRETPPHPKGGFDTNHKITPFLKNISPMPLLDPELQNSECPTRRLLKSLCCACLDDRRCNNVMVLNCEVLYCECFVTQGPTTEFNSHKQRK